LDPEIKHHAVCGVRRPGLNIVGSRVLLERMG